MQFQYLLLLFVFFQNSHTREAETSKTITVKGKAFLCLFHIQYDENTCFQNSTVFCSPDKKTGTAKNIPLELNDGTKINIQKLKISRKKDRIIRAEIINPTSPSPAPSKCNVIDGPAKGESCVFPFTWGGKTYTECAYEPSAGDTYPWCSTKVDATGNHVSGGGHWGKCNPDTCAVKTTPNPPTPAPSNCNVIDGPAKGETCVFPFTWGGKTYTECAYEPSQGDSYPWCSTKVDATGNHVSGGGHWGECNPDTCAVKTTPNPPSPTPAPSICNVIDGPAKGETCVFPFTWGGKTYTECAYEPSQGDSYPWCSTKVDATGNHVSGGGHWGECDPDTCAVPRPAQCGVSNNCEISGGTVTCPNQYPWMVRLPMGCGGALITNKHVLTAKHCFEGRTNWRGRSVKVSVHNQYDPNDYQEVEIQDYVWPDIENSDIAILILETSVNLNDRTIGTVCLPTSASKDYRGQKTMAMGWGMTHLGSVPSTLLQHVPLTVSQQQQQNILYTEVPVVDGVPQDPCAGDSGGPLVHQDSLSGRWTIIGTVWGYGYDCRTGNTRGDGRWSKVTDHLDWIKSIIS